MQRRDVARCICFWKWGLSVWGNLEVVWGLREMEVGGLRLCCGGLEVGAMIGLCRVLGFVLGEGWDG